MNNNRNSNRRRGRGNNRGGGGNQNNRIDSRARGNAPQLLEKYKKLAHDASLNDDRVQTEYYLQFADHYFRVIADIKAQKEEARARRDAEREQDDGDDSDEDDREDDRQEERGRKARGSRSRRQDKSDRDDREEGDKGSEGDEDEGDSDGGNPFTRGNRRRKPARSRTRNTDDKADAGEDGLDPDMLPPPIARGARDDGNEDDGEKAERPTRRPRKSTRRSRDEDGGEGELQAVG